jgi:lysine-specific demethylase 8
MAVPELDEVAGLGTVASAASIAAVRESPHAPCVLRGIGAQWPAVRQWSFAQLAALDPSRPVTLVVGNRERDRTRFAASTLGAYLAELAAPPVDSGPPRHLKEFDLLAAFPQLRRDLRPQALFPRGAIVASSAWIGPAHARTGLHCDRLDNVAMLVAGRKRFLLAPPGALRAPADLADKHDRWATLARLSFRQLAARGDAPLLAVDLLPGDALYVPAGWWHEVVNLEASILLSGFFGRPGRVIGQWLRTGATQAAHVAGLWRRGHCTCHG